MNDLHGILFAYRSDANLGELTRPRNTCSLAFGGRYRLIDFMLSNYVNAGITDVGVIVHESYQSLLDHLGSGKDWDLSRKHGGLRILPPFGYGEQGHGEYRGNMEALAGVAGYLKNIRQDYVIMGWGDAALNLDVEAVYDQHIASGADITVVCTPTLNGAPRFSEYVEVSADGRVTDLSVHPTSADKALESLEIYIMSKQLLMDMVEYCAAHDVHSFSRGVLQPRLKSLKLMPYVHQGYAGRFGHGLGHAVGIDIHENPRLSVSCHDILAAGTVITVEPGVYLPGIGGVRIENSCLVTENGCEALTTAPKELIIL